MQSDLCPVFENDDLLVFHEHRGSDVVLITFAHLDFPTDGGRYWGKVVLGRAGLSAVGFVSKHNDWFPRAAILPAAQAVAPLLARYSERIAYGFSMGGHAAVKHSALLQPSRVIALSPQWSIDPDDTACFDTRLTHLYSPARNARMAIGREDVSGQLIVLFDPYLTPDVEHVRRIAALFEAPEMIPTPRLGHETIDMLASSELVAALVPALLADDRQLVRELLSRRRRANGRRLVNLILALRSRHPSWAELVLDRYRNTLRPDLSHLLDTGGAAA